MSEQWKVRERSKNGLANSWFPGWDIVGPDGEIATVFQHGDPEREEKQANLIAAAPELLDALEQAILLLLLSPQVDTEPFKDLIDKAKGQSS